MMWKWVALAALIYGMLAVAAGLSPRRAALGQMLDMAAISDAWELPPKMPASYDFESPSVPPITRPPAFVEVIALPDGNHVLRWNPPGEIPLAVLGLPLSPPPDGATLMLRLRAGQLSPDAVLAVGVHERDGSLYATRQQSAAEWRQLRIPWDALQLAPTSNDENSSLDANQVDAIFIAVHLPGELADRARERQREQRPPPRPEPPDPSQPAILLEIDDVEFVAAPGR